MKKIASLLFLFAMVLTSCTGDQGPVGPPGLTGSPGAPGEDGGIIVSSAFEIEVDFNTDNGFSHTEAYGDNFEVYETDVTLVYRLWETIDGKDFWRLLPQSVTFPDGTLIYNYQFTQTDVKFFLDGNKNPTTLEDNWTQIQTFRVVVIPADNLGVDVSNLNAVMEANNITNFEIK